jgi:hypothetical protein
MATRLIPPLEPLEPGSHRLQLSLVSGADHWDGFGTDPFNRLPAGETLLDDYIVRAVPLSASLNLLALGLVCLCWSRRSTSRTSPRTGG